MQANTSKSGAFSVHIIHDTENMLISNFFSLWALIHHDNYFSEYTHVSSLYVYALNWVLHVSTCIKLDTFIGTDQ